MAVELIIGRRYYERAVKLIHQGISSLVFYGPPGSGKTTVALAVSRTIGLPWHRLDGTRFKKAEIEKILANRRRSLVFVDEIGRLDKRAQSLLLLPVEEGRVILIGSSWENPWSALIAPLRSRSVLIRFEPPSYEEMLRLVDAVATEMGLTLNEREKRKIADLAGGDARRAITLLKVFAATGEIGDDASGFEEKESRSKLISALIKSIRGSDPDAAVYYLVRYIDGGGDPLYATRRMMILASEDIGNAYPMAVVVASAVYQIVSAVGMPEGMFALVQLAIYLSTLPKSNATLRALGKVRDILDKTGPLPVPKHIDGTKSSMRIYKYPHDYGGWVAQQYLPDGISREHFVEFRYGFEKRLLEYLKSIRRES